TAKSYAENLHSDRKPSVWRFPRHLWMSRPPIPASGPRGRNRMLPARRWSGASKKPPSEGGQHASCLDLFALFGVLPSLTQMAPGYRELNKYEANKCAQRNLVQHDVTSCKRSRGHPALD